MISVQTNDRQPSREVVAQAAAWISRLHSSQRSPEVEAAFRSWLAADKDHARAFEGMTEIWDTMPAAGTAEGMRGALAEQSRYARPPVMARVASIAAVCVIAGAAYWALNGDPSYSTEIGEQRIVNLDDGTRISLNSATRIVVGYADRERRIRLKEGEAYFEVAHAPSKPFVVEVGANRVTALGTAFAVRYEHSGTAVTLVEGSVAVTPAGEGLATDGQSPTKVHVLKPGQRWVVHGDRSEKIDSPRVETLTAWRRGEVILDEMALAEAVAEMNRYGKLPIVIDSPEVAALPVSGIYRTGDSPGFAAIVARMYGLATVEQGGRIHIQGQPTSAR